MVLCFPIVIRLKKLEGLDLSKNYFEGTLPSCLYNFTSLQLLDIHENQFRVNISSLIARLTSLKLIDLRFNLFEGFSFGSLANHSRLEFVRCICNDKDVKIERTVQIGYLCFSWISL